MAVVCVIWTDAAIHNQKTIANEGTVPKRWKPIGWVSADVERRGNTNILMK